MKFDFFIPMIYLFLYLFQKFLHCGRVFHKSYNTVNLLLPSFIIIISPFFLTQERTKVFSF